MNVPETWEALRDAGDESKLRAELKPYLGDSFLGRSLKHPLVFQVGMIFPHLANAMLEEKSKRLRAALQNGDFRTALRLYERPYRLATVGAWADRASREAWSGRPDKDGPTLRPEQFRELLVSAWINTESPHQFGALPLRLFRKAAAWGILTDADPLPPGASLRVYRGGTHRSGISWTLDAGKAEWFARRFRRDRVETKVWSADARREVILAYLVGRDEEEIVVSPRQLRNFNEEVRP